MNDMDMGGWNESELLNRIGWASNVPECIKSDGSHCNRNNCTVSDNPCSSTNCGATVYYLHAERVIIPGTIVRLGICNEFYDLNYCYRLERTAGTGCLGRHLYNPFRSILYLPSTNWSVRIRSIHLSEDGTVPCIQPQYINSFGLVS